MVDHLKKTPTYKAIYKTIYKAYCKIPFEGLVMMPILTVSSVLNNEQTLETFPAGNGHYPNGGGK